MPKTKLTPRKGATSPSHVPSASGSGINSTPIEATQARIPSSQIGRRAPLMAPYQRKLTFQRTVGGKTNLNSQKQGVAIETSQRTPVSSKGGSFTSGVKRNTPAIKINQKKHMQFGDDKYATIHFSYNKIGLGPEVKLDIREYWRLDTDAQEEFRHSKNGIQLSRSEFENLLGLSEKIKAKFNSKEKFMKNLEEESEGDSTDLEREPSLVEIDDSFEEESQFF